MSEINEKNQPKIRIIVTILAAVFATLLFWSMFYDVGFQSGFQEGSSRAEREHIRVNGAQLIERECGGKQGASGRECIADVIASQRESQRGESALAAQWEATNWTKWATIVAAISVSVTGIGTILLFEQIKLTRKAVEDTSLASEATRNANQIAREALHRANRPWVSVSLRAIEEVSLIRNNENVKCLDFKLNYSVKVYGNEPASFVYIHLYCQGIGGGNTRHESYVSDLKKGYEAIPGPKIGMTCFPGNEVYMPTRLVVVIHGNPDNLPKLGTLMIVGGCAIYYYANAGTWHTTPVQFLIFLHHDLDLAADGTLPTSAFDIRIHANDGVPD